MRKVLLATAAVAVIGLSATGASADYWATANFNFGNVHGNMDIYDDIKAYRHGSVSIGNMGALTVNENEENIKIKVKGPVVDIDVDQTARNNNDQTNKNHDLDVDVADADAGALAISGAAAGAIGVVVADDDIEKNDDNNVGNAVAGSLAAAGAGAGALGIMDDVTQSNDNENYQKAGNLALIYVEDPLGGLADCACSTDDFYTLNVNKGQVTGHMYADDLYASRHGTISVANTGAATVNKSVNNTHIRVGGHKH